MKKKLTCLILTLVMLISPFYPLMPQAAMAAAVEDSDLDALGALGIDTSVAPEGFDPYDTSNPYGRDVIQLAPVSELYKVGLPSGATSYDATFNAGNRPMQDGTGVQEHPRTAANTKLQSMLYGHNQWNKTAADILGSGDSKDINSGTMTATGNYTLISNSKLEGDEQGPATGHLKEAVNASVDFGSGFEYAMSSVAAGNFDSNKNGLKAQAVMVYTSDYSNQGGLYLRFGDVVTGNYGTQAKQLLGTDKKIGNPNLTYEGEPVENFAENPYQLQNYLQVATGDWNNDGLDEVAVYIPEENNSRIVVFALQLLAADDKAEAFKDPSKWAVVWTYYLQEDNVVSNMVSLTSGDVNRDGTDDLAATWGYYYGPEQNKGSKAVVMFGAQGTQLFNKSQQFDLSFGSSNIVRAAFTYGDMAGAKEKALILAGQSDADLRAGNTNSRYVALFHWNGREFTSSVYQNFDLFAKDDQGSYIWGAMVISGERSEFYSLPLTVANVATVAQGISGGGDLLYLDSLLIKYTEEGLDLVEAWDNTPAMQGSSSPPVQYVEYAAASGDLTGETGAGSFMTMMQTLPRIEQKATNYTIPGDFPVFTWQAYYKNWLHQLFGIKSYRLVIGTGATAIYYPQLVMGQAYLVTAVPATEGGLESPRRTLEDFSTSICLANTDPDSSYMSYGGNHRFTYTDPEVLAVLASPPYFADLLDRDDLSGNYAESTTSYASSKGSGSGSTTSATITVGAYVSFEQEFSVFGVVVAKVEAEATITAGFTWETESTSTLEQTVEYTAASGEDMVAFYSIPMEIYEYTSYVPDGTGNYDEVLTAVNIPHEAAVRLLSLEEYESIAKDYQVLPTIAANVLTHEVGNPASYPTSTAGYNLIAEYVGTPAAVGFSGTGGGAAIRQEIAMSTEDSSAFTISGGIEAKAGAGAGGITVGVVAGFEGGAGTVEITTSGSSFAGEMQNMPSEAQPYGYGMNWRIFAYRYNGGGSSFPVVSYLVSDVQNPPSLPSDFAQNVAATTENSVTLDWSYDRNIAGFRILRYYDFPEGSGSQEVAFVPFNAGSREGDTGPFSFSYIDTGLSPYTEYKYQIQAVRAGNPTQSIYSEPLVGRTKTLVGYPVTTLTGLVDGVLPIYPDGNSTVTLSVADEAKYNSLSYQWQKLEDGDWVNLPGRTDNVLTISNARAADDALYRCRINAIYYDEGAAQEYYISAYSQAFASAYMKRTPVVDLQAKAVTEGLDTTLQADVEVYSGNTNHSVAPAGKITFTVSGTDYQYQETVALTKQTSTKQLGGENKLYSTARLTLPNLPEGVYSVSVYYSGSVIFQDYELPEEVLVVIGNGAAHKLELANAEDSDKTTTRFVYGEKIWPQLVLITKDGDTVTKIPVSNVTYKLFAGDAIVGAEGVESTAFTPGDSTPAVGSYQLAGYDDGNELLVTQTFTVSKQPITVAVEHKANVSSGTVSSNLPVIYCSQLSASDLGALQLTYVTYNSAGNVTELNNDTNPGSYLVIATTSADTPLALYDNYSVTYLPGNYVIIGATHQLTAEALPYTSEGVTRPVGTVGISDQSELTAKYTANSTVVLYAIPQVGYEVDTWTATFANASTYTQVGGLAFNLLTQAQAVDVSVSFKPISIRLDTSAVPASGGVITCSDEYFSSGANVRYGAEYTFTAMPSDGYHFSGWRISGNATNEGTVQHADGSNSLTIAVGSTSTTIYADFARDSYTVTLEGDISAYYLYDHDGVPGTDDIPRNITSGDTVPGDKEITVAPKPGYSAAEEAYFFLNGEEQTGEATELKFFITANSTVSLDTVRNSYAVTVLATNGTVTTTVDGTPVANDQLANVLGGSRLRFTPRSERGYVFSHWLIDDSETDDNLSYVISALAAVTQVEAVFVANTAYTVTAIANPETRGSISYTLNDIYGDAVVAEATPMPVEPLVVYEGESITFIANVVPGSMVEQWQANTDNEYTTSKTYSVAEVTGNLAVTVTLKAASYYTVYYGAPAAPGSSDLTGTGDGSSFVSGNELYGGSDLLFTATPDTGYMLDYWTITNGDSFADEAAAAVDAYGKTYVEPTYRINPLNRHLTVRAYFRALQSWDVTLPDDSEMGTAQITSVTPVDPTDSGARSGLNAVARDGGTVKMLFSPLPGYDSSVAELQAIVVEAANADAHVVVTKEADAGYQVIVSNLTQDLDLRSAQPYHALYTITVAPAEHGSVTPSTTLVRAGTPISLTVTPASGYRLSSLTLEPASVILDQPVAAGTLLYTFTMPEEPVTVTAAFQRIPAPPPPPSGGDGGGVVEPPYVSSGEAAGTRTVRATAGLIPEIVTAKSQGATSFTLDITGELPDAEEPDVLTVNIPDHIVKYLANLDVVMQTPYGDLGLPAELVAALATAGEGIVVTLQPGDAAEVADELGDADELLSNPVDITTSLRGDIQVTLDCNVVLPQDADERAAFLANLYVLAIHASDDVEQIGELELTIDAETNTLTAISFRVERFSTFALALTGQEQPQPADPQRLFTVIDGRDYEIDGLSKTFDQLTAYRTGDDVTVMAVRLLEELGAQIGYKRVDNVGVVTVIYGDITATLREQDTVMTVVTSAGTRQVTLRTVFTNRDGRTYLPTRDVAENLGFFVKWAAADDSITVTN